MMDYGKYIKHTYVFEYISREEPHRSQCQYQRSHRQFPWPDQRRFH